MWKCCFGLKLSYVTLSRNFNHIKNGLTKKRNWDAFFKKNKGVLSHLSIVELEVQNDKKIVCLTVKECIFATVMTSISFALFVHVGQSLNILGSIGPMFVIEAIIYNLYK